ncbi:flagellin [Alcanivorax sp. KX64203]|nr:flagellin [Alcanivorax sp. KX64203]
MSVINTNITAMIGQQNLGRSQSALQTSMERLSSGLRINSAKDDAAGQAIANRMSAQITGLSQAQRNANDGISVAQTAEGALNQVNDNLQRIRELTVQAQNGTNSSDDLQSIQDEINQRLDEINRISDETNFNGVSVLKESNALQIQVGANDGETITVNLKEINSETLDLEGFSVGGLSGPISEIRSVDTDGVVTVTPVATEDLPSGATLHGYGDFDPDAGTYDNYAVKLEDGTLVKVGAGDTTNNIEFDTTDGSITVTGSDFSDLASAYNADADTGITATANPLARLDEALKSVDELRSELGAVQNRFESAITNLSTNETNLSAARSRIEDADYAVEVSNMTRAQILQQAGTSVLAQANQVPQSVLSLLG